MGVGLPLSVFRNCTPVLCIPYSGTPKEGVHPTCLESPNGFKLNLIIGFLAGFGGLFGAATHCDFSNHRKTRLEFDLKARVYVPGDADDQDGTNLGAIRLEALGETARRHVGILRKRKSHDAIPEHMGCHLVEVANIKVKLYYLISSFMTEG